MNKVLNFIDSKRLFYFLIALNAFASIVIFIVFRKELGGDSLTYMGLAEGIQHGRYSYFWFFEDYLPDTFRNQGYPLFLC
jgi:hypothetical protein